MVEIDQGAALGSGNVCMYARNRPCGHQNQTKQRKDKSIHDACPWFGDSIVFIGSLTG
jgi:hypothetical protein